ncbi:MAG: BON domain-containing protein, partial [Candidatus Omnitrophica bacterium]|nr:BON domain-containing protein [Candidatus Omnitrophota bacterium]
MRIRSLFLIITIAVITGGGYCAAPVYAEGPQQSEMHMTDLQITDAIEDEYLFDDAVSGNQIDVSVYDGVATLSGKVPHILAKDRAEKIAEVVKGVRSVVNRIHVKPNPDRSDTDIQRDVSETLMANSATSSYEIIPTVKNGKVTLKGK